MSAPSHPPLIASPTTPAWYSRARLGRWVESRPIQRAVMVVIIVNAVVLGAQTSPNLTDTTATWLHRIDLVCLAVFVVELAIKLYAFGARFFRSAWNVFDFVVVALALIPGSGFAVLRALRVLRVLRLISVVPALRRVVEALVRAVPGILSIGALLVLLFYVGAVMATTLFGRTFPEYFGTLGASLVSLFQTMTMDNWSTIGREMAQVHPWVWAFFVPFILLSAFTVLNLFVAVMVDAMKFMAGSDADDDGDASAAQPGAPKPAVDPLAAADDDGEQPQKQPAPEPVVTEGDNAHPSGNWRAAVPVDTAASAELLAEVRALRAELAEIRGTHVR